MKKRIKSPIKLILRQLEELNPGEHITLTPSQYTPSIEKLIRTHASHFNRKYQTNFKVHHHYDDTLYIWYCPDQFVKRDYTAIPSSHSPGSIHFSLRHILATLNLTKHQFDALPFDQQMKLRIDAGIELRNKQRNASKLASQFGPNGAHDIPKSN